MRKLSKKSKAIIIGGAIVVLTGSGVAYSFWSAGGGGTTTATTDTTVAITVNTNALGHDLFPGDTQILSGTFDNPNPGAVRVVSVSAALGALPSGCVSGDFSIGGGAPVGVDVASGNTVGTWTGLTITMNNTGLNQDGCKAKSIPLVLTSN